MDPITIAIVVAQANLSKDVIKDSYDALKADFKKKFGEESDLVDAVDKLEKKPDSEACKAILQEEFEIVKVNDDPEVMCLVQNLLDQIKRQPKPEAPINQIKKITRDNILDAETRAIMQESQFCQEIIDTFGGF